MSGIATETKFAYYPTGNRANMTTSTGTIAYTYPATRHRLASVGGIARTFDAAGNTAAIGGTARQFVYDDTGRLNGVKQNGATVRNYRYNGKGERTRGWVGSGNNTYTLYDESGHWLGDYDNAGTPSSRPSGWTTCRSDCVPPPQAPCATSSPTTWAARA